MSTFITFNNSGQIAAAPPPPNTFDIYLSPNGDDNNAGDLHHPKSLFWLGTVGNFGANGWSTYATPTGGLRIGLLPGYYLQGMKGGVATSFYSILGQGAGPLICLTGGYPGVSGPYIGGSDQFGSELPNNVARQAIIELGDPARGYAPSPWQTIGFSMANAGIHVPPNFGNIRLGGFEVRNYTGYGVVMGENGHQSLGVIVEDCICRGGRGYHNDNNGGFAFNGCPGGIRRNTMSFDNLSSTTTYEGQVMGYFTGTTLNVTSFVRGRNLNYITNFDIILYDANGNVFNTTITPQGSGGSNSNGQVGTYTITQSIGNVGSAGSPVVINYGWPNTQYPQGGFAYICFNTNSALGSGNSTLPFTHTQNFDTCNSLDYHKAHRQNYVLSYNIIEESIYGSAPGNVPGYPTNVWAAATPASTGTGLVHHNIFAAGSLNFFNVGAPEGPGNAGAVECHHNTIYWPPDFNQTSTAYGIMAATQNVGSGTLNYHDNLHWVDPASGPYNGPQWLNEAITVGMTAKNNAYPGLSTPAPLFMALTNGGGSISLATVQTTYNIENNSFLINSTPFANPPSSGNPNSYALGTTGAGLTCRTASTTGGPIGALDGTGTPGPFMPQPLRIVNCIPAAATVGVAYAYQLLTANGTGPFTWLILYASTTANWGGWLTGGNAIPPGGYPLVGGLLQGTPQQAQTGIIVVQLTDATGYVVNETLTIIVN